MGLIKWATSSPLNLRTKKTVIPEIRAFTQLGLEKAKELVEKAPVVVKTGLIKKDAEKIIEKAPVVVKTGLTNK